MTRNSIHHAHVGIKHDMTSLTKNFQTLGSRALKNGYYQEIWWRSDEPNGGQSFTKAIHPELMEDDPNMMLLLHSSIDNAQKTEHEENNNDREKIDWLCRNCICHTT